MEQHIQKIKEGQLAPLYLIHGPELHFQEEIYKALYKQASEGGFADWNWSLFHASKDSTIDPVLEALATCSWGVGPRIVVVKGAEQLLADDGGKLVTYLQTLPDNVTLALFCQKVDSRLKVIKQLKKLGEEIVCQELTPAGLARYVSDYVSQQGGKMDNKAIEAFLARVGRSLQAIDQELDKLLLYTADQPTIGWREVEEITSIYPEQLEQGVIFQLTEAIAARDKKLALKRLHQLIDGGEPPLRVLPLIERELRLLLALQHQGSSSLKEIASQMGETSDYPLKKTVRYQGRFSEQELLDGFTQVVEADRELKLGADGERVLEQLILRLCKQ